MTPDYYNRDFNGHKLDPYRIAGLYGIIDHAIFHALKKLLRAGQKDGNSAVDEVRGALAALQRWLEIQEENETAIAHRKYLSSGTNKFYQHIENAEALITDVDGAAI